MIATVAAFITLCVIRAFHARSLPDTAPWHTDTLNSEFRVRDHQHGISFTDYQQLETRLDAEPAQFVQHLENDASVRHAGRYVSSSKLNPQTHTKNWNWSFILAHAHPRGAVVLVHGASDSPYSMRALAERLHQSGWTIVAVRLPGHGTLPSELQRVQVEDWRAVVRSAVAHARDVIGENSPLYLAGYSTGGALSVDYTLDALDDPLLDVPDGLILLSPAIAITRWAMLARADILTSLIPGFEKFAWTSIHPEFDPYKYNSFPKQAGRQTYRLTVRNQQRLDKLVARQEFDRFPPTLTFMSAVDTTVSVSAVVDQFYAHTDSNKQALVVFGVNRTNQALGFLRSDYLDAVMSARDDPGRPFDLTIVSNENANSLSVQATTWCRLNQCERTQALTQRWPADVFSLSHVALPFAPNDPIYGDTPGPDSPGPFTLGSLQPRGERGILVVPIEQLMRLRYNPFLPYLLERVDAFVEPTSSP
ncbi:MAG: alpha/beta fold hydrolase [Pseudomonadota bacterium]